MRRFPLTILALVALSVAALADATGKWTGTFVIEADKATKAKIDAQTKGKVPTVVLELNKDKTFKSTQKGAGDGKVHTVEGTWSQSGNTVAIKPKKRDGQPATGQGAATRSYVLSKDGKTLTLDLTSQVQAQAPKGGGVPPSVKVRVVLKKG
ncbi:MAG: hypothetical protein JSS66_12855 [Armatimonadetes bacterium]|nr:hypothetical protein [Armatimonadota bacterium]